MGRELAGVKVFFVIADSRRSNPVEPPLVEHGYLSPGDELIPMLSVKEKADNMKKLSAFSKE